MPQRALTSLIVASGGGATAGQSFLNNVTGSGAGNQMTNYIIEGASWSNVPSAPPTLYATPTTFSNLTLTITTFNSKASLIQRKGTNAWTVNYVSPLNTATATLNSISWSGNVGTLNLTINGEITTGTPTTSVTVWYQGYTSPVLPYGGPGNTDPSICFPDCETAYNVDFTFSAGAIAANGSTTNDLYLSYAVDAGGFNPTLFGPGPTAGSSWSILQDRRAGATPVVTAIEWATDSGFTNVVSTSTTYTISSDNNTSVSYYLRYKLDGAGSWTEWGSNPVTWTDPRNDT